MSGYHQVKGRTSARRFGLPQLALLTGAFVTAVILAAALRPGMIPFSQLRPWGNAISEPKTDMTGQMERDEAQEKLAAAMARFADMNQTPQATPAPAPVPTLPVEVAKAPPPPATAAEAAPPPPAMEPAAPAPVPAAIVAPAPTLPPLSEADMRRLNSKAAQAIRDGDILGARLILERTIEGGDAKALLALAETYDPKALTRMNAKGVKGDAAHARKLYGEALARGLSEARGRLEALDR